MNKFKGKKIEQVWMCIAVGTCFVIVIVLLNNFLNK